MKHRGRLRAPDREASPVPLKIYRSKAARCRDVLPSLTHCPFRLASEDGNAAPFGFSLIVGGESTGFVSSGFAQVAPLPGALC
jgi:hypothetical protein